MSSKDGELLVCTNRLASLGCKWTVRSVQLDPAALTAVEEKTKEKVLLNPTWMQEQGDCELARKSFQLGTKREV